MKLLFGWLEVNLVCTINILISKIQIENVEKNLVKKEEQSYNWQRL